MCGIAGYVDFGKSTHPSAIKKMTDSISYRGPDSSGSFVSSDKKVGLGIRRLSIIDLKTGDQPIGNEDGTVTVVYNGEIYNFKELKLQLQKFGHIFKTDSDTEVIVHGYEQWGKGVVSKLNGMFAFALWDGKKEKLLIGRDRVGIKPIYYSKMGKRIIFGSEAKTILKFPGFKKRVNFESVSEYLFIGFVSSQTSVFENIKKLPPGYILTFGKSGLTVEKYYELKITDNQSNEDLNKLLGTVVSDQLVSDVPVGVFLSGGLDSSLISYYISKHKKLNSFSIGFSEENFDESEHAHYVSKIIGTKHHSEEFTPGDVVEIYTHISKFLDEPISDASIIPTFKVCRLAKKHVKVVLSGDGGDELFGGYPTYQAQILGSYFDKLPKFIGSSLQKMADVVPSALYEALPLSFKDYPKKKLAQIVLTGLKYKNPQRHLYWMKTFFLGDESMSADLSENYLKAKAINNVPSRFIGQAIDLQTYLPEDFLVKVDRASSYNSLEVRVPYLDNRIIDYALSEKRKHLDLIKTKIELRKLLKKNLPQISKRPKKGFGIPLEKWLRGSLYDFAYAYLENEKLSDFVPRSKIDSIWEDHQKEVANNSGAIWQLIVLSGWLQNWS